MKDTIVFQGKEYRKGRTRVATRAARHVHHGDSAQWWWSGR